MKQSICMNHYLQLKDLVVYKPSANYILMEINDPDISVTDVQTRLEKHNLLIRSCANYKGLGSKNGCGLL